METHKQSISRILLINLAVLGILFVVFVVIGELALRHFIPSWGHWGLVELTSTPIVYQMKPNLQIVREGVEIRTNSDGFRDTDFSGEPKPGEFLIAVLGDSFVFGQGVPQSETMPVILQKPPESIIQAPGGFEYGISEYPATTLNRRLIS